MVAPKLTTDLLAQQKAISYNSCVAQMFYAHFFGATALFILVAMAYDRYAAICRPLHYMVTMNRQVCYVLVMAMGAFSHSVMQVLSLDFPSVAHSNRPLFLRCIPLAEAGLHGY